MNIIECVSDLKKFYFLTSADLSVYGIDKQKQKDIQKYAQRMIQTKGESTFKYTKKHERYYSPESIQLKNSMIRGFIYDGISTDIDQSNSSATIVRFLCRKHNIDHPLLSDYCKNREKYLNKYENFKDRFISALFYNKHKRKDTDFKGLDLELKQIQKDILKIEELKEIYKDHHKEDEENYEGRILNRLCFHFENKILLDMKKYLIFNDHHILALMFDGLLILGDHYQNESLLNDTMSFINTRYAGLEMTLKYKEHNKTIKIPLDFEEVKDDLYTTQKRQLEQHVCKINMPPCYIHSKDGKTNILKFGDLKEYAKGKYKKIRNEEGKLKNFIDIWSEDMNLKNYEKIVFDPKEENKEDYNLYKGFNFEPIEDYKEDNIFFKLCRHVINNDDLYDYFLDWVASIIQKPWKKTNNAIIFFSDTKGVGKDSIIFCLSKIFNEYYGILNSIEDLEKNFNSHLTNKLLIYGEEITSKARNFNDKLKAVITRTSCILEKKGVDAIKLDDYSNFIFSTNNENSFKVEEGCRRLCFINCKEERLIDSNIDPKEYYKYIDNKENIRNIYSCLLNRKIKFNIGVDPPPMSNYKKTLLYENKPAYIQYLYKTEARDLTGFKYSSKELYMNALNYAKKNFLNSSFTSQKCGKIMKEIFKDYIKKQSCMVYDFRSVSTNDFNKILYNYDKDYFKYINNIDKFIEEEEPENNHPELDI